MKVWRDELSVEKFLTPNLTTSLAWFLSIAEPRLVLISLLRTIQLCTH